MISVNDGNCGDCWGTFDGSRLPAAEDACEDEAAAESVEDDDFPLLLSSPLSVADSGTGGVRLRLGRWREERCLPLSLLSLWRSPW